MKPDEKISDYNYGGKIFGFLPIFHFFMSTKNDKKSSLDKRPCGCLIEAWREKFSGSHEKTKAKRTIKDFMSENGDTISLQIFKVVKWSTLKQFAAIVSIPYFSSGFIVLFFDMTNIQKVIIFGFKRVPNE